jgi:hypothetical protein
MLIPAPTYSLVRAAWVPTLVIWHADGHFTRLEGDPCTDYAAALAASWRLRPARRPPAQCGFVVAFGSPRPWSPV